MCFTFTECAVTSHAGRCGWAVSALSARLASESGYAAESGSPLRAICR